MPNQNLQNPGGLPQGVSHRPPEIPQQIETQNQYKRLKISHPHCHCELQAGVIRCRSGNASGRLMFNCGKKIPKKPDGKYDFSVQCDFHELILQNHELHFKDLIGLCFRK